ncbi:hypothetical protein MKW98_031247 [Papaver atlanticum]|uniref:Uncharacterized protein n=1 Tax=Papaver atlanticum TaxID=357466 RepID=A0AAD4S5J3_9MAGN|nr:hypothetical protein MKW98_031247 [Papaver atlanticum]
MAIEYAKSRDGKLEEIDLSFPSYRSAKQLIDMDLFSKSDPMPYLDNKSFHCIYQFGIVQPLVFRVYDINTKYLNMPIKTLKLDEQDFLGEANCALSSQKNKMKDTSYDLIRYGENHLKVTICT